MERGSTKHGPLADEALKHGMKPIEQGSPAGPRVEEGRDPEGWTDGEPVPDARLNDDPAERRANIARYLDRVAFPADRGALLSDARKHNAPVEVLSDIERIPAGKPFECPADLGSPHRRMGGASIVQPILEVALPSAGMR